MLKQIIAPSSYIVDNEENNGLPITPDALTRITSTEKGAEATKIATTNKDKYYFINCNHRDLLSSSLLVKKNKRQLL